MSEFAKLTLVLLMVLFASPPVLAQTKQELDAHRAAQQQLRECLRDAARGRSSVGDCYGRVSGRCLDDIFEAGGTLGNSAIYVCNTFEIKTWLSLWADSLQTRLWMKEKDDDSRSILDSFSQVQIRAAQKCLNAPADALMTTINSCYAATYGPFLVEALRRGRTGEQFDQDQTEIEKRTRRSR